MDHIRFVVYCAEIALNCAKKFGAVPDSSEAGIVKPSLRVFIKCQLVPSVEIEVWRGDTRLKTKVPTGPLGIDTMEDNPEAFQFRLIMQSIEVDRQIPEYQRGVECTCLTLSVFVWFINN